MKKLLIVFLLIFIMPSYATCPVNSGESVCSLPDFGSNSKPLFQNTKIEANINNTQTPLQPLYKDDLFEKIRTPNNELMQYDSGCLFGVCVKDLNQKIPIAQ